MSSKEQMNIVIAGHVDHGKSTIIGRLLADTHSLPEGKLEQVQEMCRRTSRPFEYAFLLDALKDEQAQGITIDSARIFFKTKKRNYLIIDAPGHIEFLKNMVTGASHAEAALLVIDANEGVQENSRRHGYLISMLGIKQIVVLVNKMDLVDYDENRFKNIKKEYTDFLKEINVMPMGFIPVSGREGDNIASLSEKMPWYTGDTVLSILDSFEKEKQPIDQPFRMPVQDVYKFTRGGDDRRIVAGTVESGRLRVGDEVVFYPSGKKSVVKSIEAFNAPKQEEVTAGYATGFTLTEQIYVSRGEIATRADEPHPEVTTRIRANVFWLGKNPLEMKKEYILKLGTARVVARVERIEKVINAAELDVKNQNFVNRHEVAEVILKLKKAIAFELPHQSPSLSRFVLVDDYEISGGGIVVEALEDRQHWVRDIVFMRNYKWEKSKISLFERAEKYNQKSTLILITGPKGVGRKAVAKELERKLFNSGKIIYFLGIGNVLYGVDADIKSMDIKKKSENHREEHIRRMAEVANIMLDAGVILIVTAIELTQYDLEIIKTIIEPELIETVWVGDTVTTDIAYDLTVPGKEDVNQSVEKIITMLQEHGFIFKAF